MISKLKRHTVNITGTITEKVLTTLYITSEVIGAFAFTKQDVYNSLREDFGGYNWSKTGPSKFVNNLERQGYLRKTKVGQNSVELTNKAKIRIIDKISGRRKIDGKFRFVSFDVPEEKRRARNGFRKAIKRLGFFQVQKSLWVCNKNIGDLVEIASYEYGVEKYVIYIISETTDVDGLLAKKFHKNNSSSCSAKKKSVKNSRIK